MSRLAKKPIEIPNGVNANLQDNILSISGPKGELKRSFRTDIINIEINTGDNTIKLSKTRNDKFANSLIGTYASHIKNMIKGVVDGFEKELEIHGVGYKWSVSGNKIVMSVGFSHDVEMDIPEGIDVSVEKNNMKVSGIDIEAVTGFAAKIKAIKKPDAYKGKGIRYKDERIILKEGKKAA